MEAFATWQDLETRMQRTFSQEEQEWVEELLKDSAEYLRGIVGEQIYPAKQFTFEAWPDRGWVDLPATVLQSVDSVEVSGSPVSFTKRFNRIYVTVGGPVDVTITAGFSEAPRDLVALNCALVSSQLLIAEAGLGLQVGGLSSVALDDFRISFADAGANTGGLSLPAPQQEYLRSKYSAQVFTTGG